MRSKVKLADGLAVLDHEGHVVGTHLECGTRTPEASGRVEPEAGVEEPRIVGAEFTARRVVRRHLGCQVGGDADGLVRHQEVEALRGQNQPVAVLSEDRIPERRWIDLSTHGEIEERGAVAGAVANLAAFVAVQVETEEEAV